MLKRMVLPLLAGAFAIALLTPPKAAAQVSFGVTVGPSRPYGYVAVPPPRPYYGYGYAAVPPYPYVVSPPPYVAAVPRYVYPPLYPGRVFARGRWYPRAYGYRYARRPRYGWRR
jgi:hypothetical protein